MKRKETAMTGDLEETLRELGPGYREVVGRLLDARETPGRFRRPACGDRPRWFVGDRPRWLAAAAVAVVASFVAVFALAPSRQTEPAVAVGGEYRLALVADGAAIRELIRTQNADGSWKTDFLTKRNAAALKGCDTAEARIAYKKAMRNLRIRGVENVKL